MVVASLLRNRLQSGLTVLGVGIGIAAVICTAALGAAGAHQGVWPSFFDIRRRTVVAGTLFGEADEAASARVLVLGHAVAERLFGTENPIGRQVRINRFPFKIIGVLEPRGADRGGVDRDDVMFVPLSTALRNLDRRDWVTDIMCAVNSPDQTDVATAEPALLLRVRHALEPDEPDDFQIQRPVEVLRMRAQTASTLTAMLTSIGAVSLVVGGAVGWATAETLSTWFAWPTIVDASVMGWAVAAALSAGLAFGYLPAHQASLFDPIEAMRAEE